MAGLGMIESGGNLKNRAVPRLAKVAWPLPAIIAVLLAGCGQPLHRTGGPAPVIERGGQRVPPLRPAPRRPAEIVAPRRDDRMPEDSGTQIAIYRRSAPPPVPTGPVYSSASRSLLARAKQLQRDGDLAGAASSVERALRIEPRNAHLWHRLAELRLAQERFRMAVDLAAKSNALAGADQRLKRNNWLLIADAWRASGEPEKARRAEMRAGR